MFDMKAFRENLTLEQVIEVVIAMGSEPPITDRGAYCFNTICHNEPGGTHKHKLYYYPSTFLFHCFTECSKTFDILELVRDAHYTATGEVISLFQSADRIRKIVPAASGFGIERGPKSTLCYLQELDGCESTEIEERKLPILDEAHLKNIRPTLPLDWIDEGMTVESLRRYEIGYDPVSIAIAIPVRDDDGDLVGIRCRRLEEPACDAFGRYGPLITYGRSYSYPISFTIYGLFQVKDEVVNKKKAIIFEGEKSCILSHTYFGERSIAVAVQGSNISVRQMMALKRYGVEEVTIAFDKWSDSESEHAYVSKLRRLAGNLLKYVPKVAIIVDKNNLLGFKDSPIDCGVENFIKLYTEREFIEAK